MLQVFHLDVAKVDRILHMLNVTYLSQPPATADGGRCRAVGDVWAVRAPPGHAKRLDAGNEL